MQIMKRIGVLAMGFDSILIGGTYRITGQISTGGGGGAVYIADHVRLGKKVVLKADMRKLTAKPDGLRSEVDALKNLSHTYIPQVYDFIEENETVYTVMDHIDGESLDKPLGRGERFSQAQVVEWARQLLEALMYLHNRPPHGILHADIKPSNIMLTPQGDVRLIDFNIALALGVEGAVSVGRSFGYASPEHYGLDNSFDNMAQAPKSARPPNAPLDAGTEHVEHGDHGAATVLDPDAPPGSDGGPSGANKIGRASCRERV